MTRILTDPAEPHMVIVNLQAHGRPLCVRVERSALRRALQVPDTFWCLARAAADNIDRLREAAWAQHQRTGRGSVCLALADLLPHVLPLRATTALSSTQGACR